MRDFLVSQGIAAEKIETRAEGKTSQLDEQRVEELQSQNAQKPQDWMASRKKATWLAYNRRVDIILEPTGQESTQAYPNDTPDAHVLWQRQTPSVKSVEKTEGVQNAPQIPTVASNQ